MIKGFAYDYDDPDNSGIFYEEDGRRIKTYQIFVIHFLFHEVCKCEWCNGLLTSFSLRRG